MTISDMVFNFEDGHGFTFLQKGLKARSCFESKISVNI